MNEPSAPSQFSLDEGQLAEANFELYGTVSGYGDELRVLMNDRGEMALLRLAGCYLLCNLPVRGMIEAITNLKEIRDFWADQPASVTLPWTTTPAKTLQLPAVERGDLILPE